VPLRDRVRDPLAAARRRGDRVRIFPEEITPVSVPAGKVGPNHRRQGRASAPRKPRSEGLERKADSCAKFFFFFLFVPGTWVTAGNAFRRVNDGAAAMILASEAAVK